MSKYITNTNPGWNTKIMRFRDEFATVVIYLLVDRNVRRAFQTGI
jgi:hypothetical protein